VALRLLRRAAVARGGERPTVGAGQDDVGDEARVGDAAGHLQDAAASARRLGPGLAAQVEADPLRRQGRRGDLGVAPRQVGRALRRHRASLSGGGGQPSLGAELGVRRQHRVPAHPQLLRQGAVAGQGIAGAEPPAVDLAHERVGDLEVDGLLAAGVEEDGGYPFAHGGRSLAVHLPLAGGPAQRHPTGESIREALHRGRRGLRRATDTGSRGAVSHAAGTHAAGGGGARPFPGGAAAGPAPPPGCPPRR